MTRLAMPQARTLAALIDEMADLRGDAPLVFYHEAVISYREGRDQADRLACALLELGVREGERVGVLLGNQPEWIVATLAAHKIGATVVPLSTWYKHSEIDSIVRRTRLRTVVSVAQFLKQDYAEIYAPLLDGGCIANLILTGPPTGLGLCWDDVLAGDPYGASPTEVADRTSAMSPDQPAFILFTSGTSAEPKGVQLAHRSLIENGYHIGLRRRLVPDDRIWLGAPLFYGLGAGNAFPMALTHGAALVIHDYFTPAAALAAIEHHRATVYYGTGNMTKAILAHSDYAPHRVASLAKGLAGITPEYKRLTIEQLGVSGATPSYGLTEAYGHVTGGEPDDPLETKIATEGRPLDGIELLIVDPVSGAQLPAGQVGKIVIGGLMFVGYLDNPTETAKAFRPDGRLETGDLGLLDEHGRLVFRSRSKDVIKTGGVNVSPREVEQLIIGHPAVDEVHVVGVETGDGDQWVVAFVVAAGPLQESDIKQHVRESAASFKAPSHVFFCPGGLPRLVSGKVAERELVERAHQELAQLGGS
jgi:fatty-acyl-CoA synthase